jgi:mono/diheme cytochrome c family protein
MIDMQFGNTRKESTRTSRPCSLNKLGSAIAVVMPALLISCAGLVASSAAGADASSGHAKHGQAIFKERCIACHNKQPGDTTPFGPPNLNGIFRGPSHMSTKDAVNIIENGKSPMPGFGTVLTKNDVNDLIAYLRTL